MDSKNDILDIHHTCKEETPPPAAIEIRRTKLRRKDKELTSYIFLELLLQTLVWDFQDLE